MMHAYKLDIKKELKKDNTIHLNLSYVLPEVGKSCILIENRDRKS